MKTLEQVPTLSSVPEDEIPTVKMDRPPAEGVESSKPPQESAAERSAEQFEQAKQAEFIAKQAERLTEDPVFTRAADNFLEIIDDTFVMRGARGAWNKMPEGAQDAYLAARFVPNPAVNLYPQLTKLMVDMGVLEHKGAEAEKKVTQGIENDRRFDQFISEVTKVIPEAQVAAPIVDQIIKAKEAVRVWMDGRRSKLLAVRRVNESKRFAEETKKADTEQIKSLRSDINNI